MKKSCYIWCGAAVVLGAAATLFCLRNQGYLNLGYLRDQRQKRAEARFENNLHYPPYLVLEGESQGFKVMVSYHASTPIETHGVDIHVALQDAKGRLALEAYYPGNNKTIDRIDLYLGNVEQGNGDLRYHAKRTSLGWESSLTKPDNPNLSPQEEQIKEELDKRHSDLQQIIERALRAVIMKNFSVDGIA